MELEYKFMLGDAVQGESIVQAIRAGTLDGARLLSEKHIEMDSSYFDTDSGALWQAGLALRLRRENGRQVCCLKSGGSADPSGLSRRGELECVCETLAEGVERLKKLDAPPPFYAFRVQDLHTIAIVRFARCACLLDIGGAVCELAFDQGHFGAQASQNRFCELELEFKSGGEAAFCAFAERLARRYVLKPEQRSKLFRALAAGC